MNKKEKKTFCCLGFFGIPNIGDELLCKVVTDKLEKAYPGSDIYLMTHDAAISKGYCKSDFKCIEGAYPAPNYFCGLFNRLKILHNTDLFVIGGGGLIADYYSWTSIPHYSIDALWCILLGRPYVFIGLGVRKLRRVWFRSLARFVCKNSAVVYCRDMGSYNSMYSLIRTDSNLVLGPDLANMFDFKLDNSVNKNEILINLREDPPIESSEIFELCKYVINRGFKVKFLAAERPDILYYQEIIKSWSSDLKENIDIYWPKNLVDSIDTIMQSGYVIAERLHVCLIATHMRKKVVALTYESKVKEFMRMVADSNSTFDLSDIGILPAKFVLEKSSQVSEHILQKLSFETNNAFTNSICKGLNHKRYLINVRLIAFLYLVFVILISFAWCFTVLLKRIVRKKGDK
jgi:N-acetylglucosaminyldiphosphoundecaprenol N-acetyl-beta-D-mannosaminyltransferase